MNPVLQNILAVFAGLVIGSIVNMSLVTIGPMLIPPPAGTDTTTMEGLEAAMPLFSGKHFIFPFLAHALGSLVGTFIAFKFSANNHTRWAYVLGVFFLLGGIMAAHMFPAPLWFEALDLIFAYLPMAWLATKLARGRTATE